MSSTPLVSVIIPVYNVGRFLTPCLDSLMAQTYQNLEILLIDDGSTDGSGECCDAYAAKDSRFKVTHKENGGVSSARNLGLDLAQGKYIAFIDSDDYVKPDYFEVLVRNIIEQDVDIVYCNHIPVTEEGDRFLEVSPSIKQSQRVCALETVLHQFACGEGRHYSVVWGSLISAKLAKSGRFSKRIIGEDTLFMFEMLFSQPAVYLDAYEGYYYVQRASGVMTRINRTDLRRISSVLPVHCYIYTNCPPLPDEDRKFFLFGYAQQVYNMAHISAGLSDRAERRYYYELLEEHLQRLLPIKKDLPKSWSNRLTMYAKYPGAYSVLARFMGALRKAAGR